MTGPKVLLLDIETSPVAAWVWSLWKQDVSLNQIDRDWYMLTWAAKWLNSDEIMSDALISYRKEYRSDPEDDSTICASLYDLIDEADILVGHNLVGFDKPKAYAKFLEHGWMPPSPTQNIDTLQIAKGAFRLTSNKLDYIARLLGVGQKTEHEGFDLWKKCMAGDRDAWARMVEYNENDVLILEDVYHALAPYSKSHPNHALYTGCDAECCTVCGSMRMMRQGYAYTTVSKFQRYQCKDCGKWMRGRTSVLDAGQKKSLLTNLI